MKEEELQRIRDHIEIHARREPRARRITQILWKAVEELEATKELEQENNILKNLIQEQHKIGNDEFWKNVWACIRENKYLEQQNKKLQRACKRWFDQARENKKEVVRLLAQIEKMKNCCNCDHYRRSNSEDWCNDHYGQPMYDEECKGKWKLKE